MSLLNRRPKPEISVSKFWNDVRLCLPIRCLAWLKLYQESYLELCNEIFHKNFLKCSWGEACQACVYIRVSLSVSWVADIQIDTWVTEPRGAFQSFLTANSSAVVSTGLICAHILSQHVIKDSIVSLSVWLFGGGSGVKKFKLNPNEGLPSCIGTAPVPRSDVSLIT